ncbi:crotonase/enoyl-CoA hydratase family protein [uncultured Methylobacterium sp.]|uniref:crotonase/enoyl-CoA hydratase family protein n=1 Tax=uncultured Methylobacterium sp. TaxID=157278 RepID=UPI0035CC9F9E
MASFPDLKKGPADFPNPISALRRQGNINRQSETRVAAPNGSSENHLPVELQQIEVNLDVPNGTLWAFMRPDGRPCQNTGMLSDFKQLQDSMEKIHAENIIDVNYFVFGSRFPKVFSLGGDLHLFASKIREKDEAALIAYGNSCVEVLHRNMNALNMPLITIGLVQGDALGGGFEGLLSFDLIIAEKGTKFGFPEILFGLFPGMGAYSFLARRLGPIKAQELILGGKTYTAEEMHELGIVHILAEPGRGEAAVRSYISGNRRRRNGQQGIYQAAREVDRISLEELQRIVIIWAATAMKLTDRDISVMERLISAQDRLSLKAKRLKHEYDKVSELAALVRNSM